MLRAQSDNAYHLINSVRQSFLIGLLGRIKHASAGDCCDTGNLFASRLREVSPDLAPMDHYSRSSSGPDQVWAWRRLTKRFTADQRNRKCIEQLWPHFWIRVFGLLVHPSLGSSAEAWLGGLVGSAEPDAGGLVEHVSNPPWNHSHIVCASCKSAVVPLVARLKRLLKLTRTNHQSLKLLTSTSNTAFEIKQLPSVITQLSIAGGLIAPELPRNMFK